MRLAPLSFCALMLGTAGFGWAADDPPMHRATPTQGEMIKDCIRKHQAGDVNLSKSELKRICKAELKQQGSPADAPPPQDAPRN